MDYSESGQGATGNGRQESWPKEGRCQEGGGKGTTGKGDDEDSAGQENGGEDGPGCVRTAGRLDATP